VRASHPPAGRAVVVQDFFCCDGFKKCIVSAKIFPIVLAEPVFFPHVCFANQLFAEAREVCDKFASLIAVEGYLGPVQAYNVAHFATSIQAWTRIAQFALVVGVIRSYFEALAHARYQSWIAAPVERCAREHCVRTIDIVLEPMRDKLVKPRAFNPEKWAFCAYFGVF
jgi:hypothetical protein